MPDPTVGEPQKCVVASGVPDAKTPFDVGFTCACLDGACVLAAGSAAERDALEAARVFTAARYPSCTGDAIRNLELRRWDGTGHAFVWMNCHCGDDCGYSCEFEVALDDAKGTWAVVPQEYLCGVK